MEKEKKKKKKDEAVQDEVEMQNHDNSLNKEIEDLKAKLAEEQAKSLRIQADMLNFKKRKEDEIASFYKYADMDVIEKILPTVDNFERAINMKVSEETGDEVKKYLEGFKMIYSNLVKLLTDLGVTEIEAEGMEFNPNYHQAVLTENDDTKPSNVVVEVLQKGYMFKDKVIRPAMVKVNN